MRRSRILSACPTVLLLTAAVMAFLAAPIRGDQNLLMNGDFEMSPDPFDPGGINKWAVFGTGDIQALQNVGYTTSSHSAAFNVTGNSDQSVLGQTFSTNSGQYYALDFDAGIYGTPTSPPQFRVQVMDGIGSLIDTFITPPSANTFDPNLVQFRHYHYVFLTNTANTTLTFMDFGTGNASSDTLLDSVSITPTSTPTPTPSPNPGPNIVANGDFETPPFDVNGDINGWAVGSPFKVTATAEGATSGTHAAAFNVGGDSQGTTLTQTLQTSPGHLYVLSFDTGLFGQKGGPVLMHVQALGGSAVLDQTVAAADVGFQHYQFFFTADSTTTTLQFADVGAGNGGSDTLLDTVAVGAQQGAPLSYTDWKTYHFTSGQQNNPNISGWSADPDKDGIRNGLEYFCDIDPMGGFKPSESAAIPQIGIQTDNGSRYLTFSYRRPIGWNGIPAVVAVANSIPTWDTTGGQLQVVGSPVPVGDGISETVTVRLSTPLGTAPQHKFLQLQLTQ